ncbi:hypothetical protein MVEN_00753300 [Mycena venus]|uniref:Uncharacterized protein n=1 Tax=Mycena venus TaxID=2733690 RepID=A0A8H6YLS2_9AGAR|nr:hypothetical protein MVEN_00753300 [Mycena venus]
MGCNTSKTARNLDDQLEDGKGRVKPPSRRGTITATAPSHTHAHSTTTAGFSTGNVGPGRTLAGSTKREHRDPRTGMRIYAPTDPDHPSKRPPSKAFRRKYAAYYDGTMDRMPAPMVWE